MLSCYSVTSCHCSLTAAGCDFLSAVKLNLTSCVLDDMSPSETHSEDSNKPLGRKCSALSGLTQLGDTSDKMLFNTSRGIRRGG